MQTEITIKPPSLIQERQERSRYEKCIEASRRVRWDIDEDVLRGREFDFATSFLPTGLTLVNDLPFLGAADRRLMSQIQGRTYANVFGLVERFVNAMVLDLSRDHRFGDQKALEAMVRFSDEELKHQELFRRVEDMIGRGMPAGYSFLLDPDEVAGAVMSKSRWAVLALTCNIEIVTQVHYKESIAPNADLSPLFKDVFLYHWREESQHAILDELEWRREDANLGDGERDRAVEDLIALVGAVDGLLQVQSAADVAFFLEVCEARLDAGQREQLLAGVLKAYRWQYIVSGSQHPRFGEILGSLVSPEQGQRIGQALAPLMG